MGVDDTAVPEGWYPDPRHADLDRWWTGGRWTDRTRPAVRDVTATVPRPASPVTPPDAGPAVGDPPVVAPPVGDLPVVAPPVVAPQVADPPTVPVQPVAPEGAAQPATLVQPAVTTTPWPGAAPSGSPGALGGSPPPVTPPVAGVPPAAVPPRRTRRVPVPFLVALTALVVVVAVGVAYVLGRSTGDTAGVTAADGATTSTAAVATTAPPPSTTVAPVTTGPAPAARPASVSRTCGAGGRGDCFVSVRTGPTSVAPEIARLTEGGATSVMCQVDGGSVLSSVLGRRTSVWWRDAEGHYVSAAFVDVDGTDPFTISVPC